MKLSKPIITITALATIIAAPLVSSPVMAFTINPTRAAVREERQAVRMDLKKDRALQEIDRRVNSLNNLIGILNAMKRLSTEQKSSFASQIQTEISNLQTLRTKIQNDTDAATLTADKQSIVKSYRVYALFMPQIRIMAHADRILTLADEMKAKTSNSTALAKIADAQTQAQNAINTVSSLTPEGYPGNKTTLQSARSMLKTALEDLKTARQSMK